jgi:hypothetical protein
MKRKKMNSKIKIIRRRKKYKKDIVYEKARLQQSKIHKIKRTFWDTIKFANVKGRCKWQSHMKKRKNSCKSGSVWIRNFFRRFRIRPEPTFLNYQNMHKFTW